MSIEKPDSISSWVWFNKQTHLELDLDLWQQCLRAACDAEAKDVTATAEKMYDQRNGKRRPATSRRGKKPLKSAGPTCEVMLLAGSFAESLVCGEPAQFHARWGTHDVIACCNSCREKLVKCAHRMRGTLFVWSITTKEKSR